MKRTTPNLLLILFAAILLPACGKSGPTTVPVTGTVTLDDQPLPEAAVMFSGPEGKSPVTAMTDAQGQFTAQVPIGASTIAVAKTVGGNAAPISDPNAALMPASGAPTAAPKSPVPAKYSNMKTSDLKADVQKGMAPVKLELSTK